MAPSTTTLAVIGDFGLAGTPESNVAALVHSWAPDAILTVGDNNYPTGAASTIDANVGQYYHGDIAPYKGSYGAGAASNRFFPTLGNHDWGDTYPNPSGDQPYLNYFTLPGNGRYYTFTVGQVQFFALDNDANEPDGITSTSTQATWLQNALAASTATYKIVYMHHPPYSSSNGFASPEARWPYQAWGATAVLSGHSHVYERLSEDNNFPYFVDGLGGEPEISSFDNIDPGSQVRYNADFGAMRVTATDSQIQFQFITRTGTLIDSYSISAHAGLNDPGFETPGVDTGAFEYNPAGGPWTFQGSAGLAGNGSLFTSGNPGAPQGSQVAYLQAIGSISQNVYFPAGTFNLSFSAAQRGNLPSAGQTFQVLVDGTVVGSFNNLAGTSYQTLTTSSFVVAAGSHTVLFQGTDLHGGDNTVFLDQVAVNVLPVGLADSGFETPAVGNGAFQYNPSGGPWTFQSSAGLAGNGSLFTSGNPGAPQGSQVVFLQGGGSVSQNVTFPAGTFSLSFSAAQRGNLPSAGQTFQVLIDGTVVGSFNNLVGSSYQTLTTSSFVVAAGSHTILFQGTDLQGGDNTAFLDQVAVTALPAGLADSGFEMPAVGNGAFQYNPSGGPWTFQGSAGLAANSSLFTSGNPGAPQGSQVAFLQAIGSISQSVVFPAGTFNVSFSAAQRGNLPSAGQTFQVLVDGAVVSSFNTLKGPNYVVLASSNFTVAAGSHTIALRGTDLNGGDNTVFLDQIMINPIP